MDASFSDLNFNSVENVPGYEARAAFTVNSSSVFREDIDIVSTIVDDTLSYIPWGGDNQMPFDILNLIEKDETLATCQIFNAEVCYGSGLRYDTCVATAKVKSEVEDFTLDNDLAAYFLRCQSGLQALRLRCLSAYPQRGGHENRAPVEKGSLLLPLRTCRCKGQNTQDTLRQLAQAYLGSCRHRGYRPARQQRAVARSARQTRQEVKGQEICYRQPYSDSR